MSNEIRNVSLSFPCREDWEKFEVVPGGRLCASCKHIVRDFRDCSMTELTDAIKGGEHVCGRFRKEQLSPAYLKVAALALSVAVAASCNPESPVPERNVNSPSVIAGEMMGKWGNVDHGEPTVGIVALDSVEIVEIKIPSPIAPF